ncbi:hypothetical protein OG723_39070 [Streptomyces sp. NBC_01278]|uniref:hypothetical protein n=1 Tax=Streptomyces sp. NBC_01278 TaxID=2903809 RepID=UPI002E35B709|nr:hypothetical protein [Streptomyces sp. NBC_01278]
MPHAPCPMSCPPGSGQRSSTALRNGQDVAAAAQAARLDLRTVFTAARTDTALTLLLAGTDPDGLGAD